MLEENSNTITDFNLLLWAFCFIGVLIGVILILLFRAYIGRKNNLIKARKEAEQENQRQMQDMMLKALRSQMNPHFVHNSLNAIQYFIQRNEVELSEVYLVKFSKLIRLFFEYSRKQVITLAQEMELLEYYLQIEQLRFEDKFQYYVETDTRLQPDEQLLPSMILQPLVENAVNHGLFHKQEQGNVYIRFIYVEEDVFTVEIEDDGIGINKSREIQKQSTNVYQSRSSNVLQERLELLNNSGDWDIAYTIEDLLDTTENPGTLVRITFKQP